MTDIGFRCPQCGKRFDVLQVPNLMDPASGLLYCDNCQPPPELHEYDPSKDQPDGSTAKSDKMPVACSLVKGVALGRDGLPTTSRMETTLSQTASPHPDHTLGGTARFRARLTSANQAVNAAPGCICGSFACTSIKRCHGAACTDFEKIWCSTGVSSAQFTLCGYHVKIYPKLSSRRFLNQSDRLQTIALWTAKDDVPHTTVRSLKVLSL